MAMRNPAGEEYDLIGQGSYSRVYFNKRGKGDLAVEIVTGSKVGKPDASKDVLIDARAALLRAGLPEAASRLPQLRRKRLDVSEDGNLEFVYASPLYDVVGVLGGEWKAEKSLTLNGVPIADDLPEDLALACQCVRRCAEWYEDHLQAGWRWDIHHENLFDTPRYPEQYAELVADQIEELTIQSKRLKQDRWLSDIRRPTAIDRQRSEAYAAIKAQMSVERQAWRQLLLLDPIVCRVPALSLAALWQNQGFKLPKELR